MADAIEPLPCPTCGIFQPKMVTLLLQRNPKLCHPNKFAVDRIAVPVESAWRSAGEANTIASYTRFMEVWPTYSDYVKAQIAQIKHPPHVRRLLSILPWIAYGGVVLIMIGIVFAHR